MTRAVPLTRRSMREWGGRLVLALVIAALAYFCVTRTLAYAVRTSDIARAHALAPEDGRITALAARQLVTAEATPAERARRMELAHKALLQDPTTVAAAATLGLDVQVGGNVTQARRLFAYAEALSRRDLATQLWAIEDAVARADVSGALHHYDIALRTARNAPELLFPVIAAAVGNPEIRVALARVLATRPAWSAAFVYYIANEAPDPQATAALFLMLHRTGTPISKESQAAILKLLVARDRVETAWAYYQATHPGADRLASRDPRFVADPGTASPFDWNAINDAGITTSIQAGSEGGIVDFNAPSGIGGPVLRQLQLLRQGRYRIEGHAAGMEQSTGSRPYWTLICRDGRDLGRVDMLSAGQAAGDFSGSFDVPAGCPVQTLTLMAPLSASVSGLSGQVDRVRLRPEN